MESGVGVPWFDVVLLCFSVTSTSTSNTFVSTWGGIRTSEQACSLVLRMHIVRNVFFSLRRGGLQGQGNEAEIETGSQFLCTFRFQCVCRRSSSFRFFHVRILSGIL